MMQSQTKSSETNNIPKLRFPKFRDTWENKSLADIGTFKNGINKSKEDFGFGYPFINLMDVFGKQTVSDLKLDLVNADQNELQLYNLKKGDVLFIRSSVKREGVGETSLLLTDFNNTVYSGFLIRFRDEKVNLDLLFKKYCFSTRKFRKNLLSLSTTSANTNINQGSLSSLKISLPSLPEQQKIATFLSSVDEWIESLQLQKESLEKYKKGMLQKLFSQQIRFKDENGKEFPDWEEKKLGDICKFFSGGTPLSTNKNYYIGEIPFIKSGEISNEYTEQFISEEALINSSAKIIKQGDLLYALYGATSGEVAISKINGAINQAVLCIKSSENKIWLFHYLRFNKDRILARYLQGGQGNLSADIIKKLKIFFPSLNEQEKIAKFLSSLDSMIEFKQEQISQTELWKKGLMQKMFI